MIEKRLRLASEADFAMAFYNPRSNARPDGFARVLEVLKECCKDDRPVIFARAINTKDETLNIVELSNTTPEMADMRTMVIVGSSQTRLIERTGQTPWVYTPRSVSE